MSVDPSLAERQPYRTILPRLACEVHNKKTRSLEQPVVKPTSQRGLVEVFTTPIEPTYRPIMPQVACEVYCKETCALEVLAVEHSVKDLTPVCLSNGTITHSTDAPINAAASRFPLLSLSHCLPPT